MTIISRQQGIKRWDTIPEKIREALVSEPNNQFIWKTCETEHLPKEKLGEVLRTCGLVLMGFIHAGDFVQELKESLDLNSQIATSIASAINERIFKPLSADLEKIYEPPSAIPSRTATAPKPSVLETKSFSSIQGKPTAPQPIAKTESPKPTEKVSTPIGASGTNMASPFQIKLTDAPDTKTEIKPGVPVPPKPPMPPSASSFNPLDKFGTNKPTTSSAEPPPTIIHKEPSLSPVKSAKEFKIDIPQPKLSEVKLNVPPRPAVLEFGTNQPSPIKPAPAQPNPNQFNQNRMAQPSSPQAVRPNSPQTPPRPQMDQSSSPKMNMPAPRPLEVPKPPAPPNINRNISFSPTSPRQIEAKLEQKKEEQIFRPTRSTDMNPLGSPSQNNSFTKEQEEKFLAKPGSSQTSQPNSQQKKEEKVRIVHYTESKTTSLDSAKTAPSQSPAPQKPASPPMPPVPSK